MVRQVRQGGDFTCFSLKSDIFALPIVNLTGAPYRSGVPRQMPLPYLAHNGITPFVDLEYHGYSHYTTFGYGVKFIFQVGVIFFPPNSAPTRVEPDKGGRRSQTEGVSCGPAAIGRRT